MKKIILTTIFIICSIFQSLAQNQLKYNGWGNSNNNPSSQINNFAHKASILIQNKNLTEDKIETNIQTSMDDYIGKYKFSDGYLVTIKKEQNKLIADTGVWGAGEMKIKSKDKFYIEKFKSIFTFVRNKNGNVTQIISLYEGELDKGIKIK